MCHKMPLSPKHKVVNGATFDILFGLLSASGWHHTIKHGAQSVANYEQNACVFCSHVLKSIVQSAAHFTGRHKACWHCIGSPSQGSSMCTPGRVTQGNILYFMWQCMRAASILQECWTSLIDGSQIVAKASLQQEHPGNLLTDQTDMKAHPHLTNCRPLKWGAPNRFWELSHWHLSSCEHCLAGTFC